MKCRDSLRCEKLVKATGGTVRAGHARPETVCTVHAGHSDEWLFLTVQDKPRKTDEVATIEVLTDADWAGDTKSMKSTSSVFTRIDGFTIAVNAQLQDTLRAAETASSTSSELRRRILRESNSGRSRHAIQDQSAM